MPRQLTRAERYKRNYRLIKNTYQDSKLAKKAQSWSDNRIYDELGIKVSKRRTPEIREVSKAAKTRAKRKLKNFQYAREIGLSVEESKKVTKYKQAKIKSTYDYLKTKTKRMTLKNKISRMDLWSEWSGYTRNMPPNIERAAIEINRATIVGGRQLDDDDHYGYVVQFYLFVENKTMEEIEDLVKPDPHDSYKVLYKTVVSV